MKFVCGFLSVLVSLWFAITCPAQTPQTHVDAAKALAYRPGQDFTWIFDELCKQPAPPQPRAAAQASPAPVTRTTPPLSEWFHEPVKVFDNLYYVGSQLQSMWAVTTSEGIILHDTAYDYMVEEQVDKPASPRQHMGREWHLGQRFFKSHRSCETLQRVSQALSRYRGERRRRCLFIEPHGP